MLNVTPIRGSNPYAAAHYFSTADDYYAKEHPGEWQGEGAQMLGLAGPVDQAQFARLLNGHLPTGEQIATTFDRTDNKKRMGLDLTFSAPKSVSMQALVAGDRNVTAAHDYAVARALDQVERLAEARKKVQGKSYRVRTGNLVIGKFRHEMSRARDPQLHTHAVILNMTRRADGAWRALSNEDIFRVQHEIDALYKTELARGLQELGYAIRVLDDKGAFELAHISRDQIEAFSARGMVIEEALANNGKTRATATALEKQVIALATRPKKDESDRALIKQYWIEKSLALGIDFGAAPSPPARLELGGPGTERDASRPAKAPREAALRAAPNDLPAGLTPARVIVDYAIRHLTEREAVVTQTMLTATALRRAVGVTSAAEVHSEIGRLVRQGTLIEAPPAYRMAAQGGGPSLSSPQWKRYLQHLKGWSSRQAHNYVSNAIRRGSLVPAEKRYTTQKALKREQAILAIERTGRGQVAPILAPALIRKALEGTTLNSGQRDAVEAIVGAGNRFVGIQGDAGTGKTYAMRHAVALIEQADSAGHAFRTVALAPYGNQVKALKSAGVVAHTLASFLRTKHRPIDGNTVILLDESAVVGARQMEQVMRIVEKAGARMVMLGDTKQTEAIEAGKPFAQLQDAGMQTARISEIQRQVEPRLKEAVAFAAQSRTAESLAHLTHVTEVKLPAERHRTIVADYVALSAQDRHATLIVAGTNQARREINRMVRDQQDLTGKGRMFDTLVRVDLTQAQRRFAPSYQVGMVVQPERDYIRAGLVRGETYHVREALPGNMLVLQRQDGSSTAINPRKLTKLSVYGLERAEIAVGDTMRINRNDPRLDLTNGDRVRITSIIGGVVQLETAATGDGRAGRRVELPAYRPMHIEHAYASTVHSAQGLTSDRTLIALETKSRTTSMNLYYVAISRARQEARVYCDSGEALPAAIARRFEKTSATALLRERQAGWREAGASWRGSADGKEALAPRRREFQAARAPGDGSWGPGL